MLTFSSMRRFMFFFLGSFLLTHFVKAIALAEDKNDEKSLLWRISGKGMQRPSYLFGTMHLLCKDDFLWTPAMESALAQVEEVCFEMDINDPSLSMQIAMGMIHIDGKKLRDYFTEEEYTLVERFVTDSLSMNMVMLQQMKPAALLTLFATKVINCMDPISYESKILEIALQLEKTVSGLETAQEQIALFDRMPGDSVVKELVSMAKDYQEERFEYNKMLRAYKSQDISALYDRVAAARESGADMNIFLDERNVLWIERMEEKMEQNPVFFAVGAGHLGGENGLISLLRQHGYKVEPVK